MIPVVLGPSSGPYSPECLEGAFSEVRRAPAVFVSSGQNITDRFTGMKVCTYAVRQRQRPRISRKVASEDKGATPPLGERALLTGRAAFGTPPLRRGLRFAPDLPTVLALWAGARQHFGASCT